MIFSRSFKEVLEEAKIAFEEIERSPFEKGKKEKLRLEREFPKLKSVGFVDGTRQMLVYR